MIYLDNSATTNYKPIPVRLALLKSQTKKYSANAGRSGHKLSINAAEQVETCRDEFNNYFNNSGSLIFTSGCTEALNLALFGTQKQDGHVITTIYEHNSTLRPLFKLQKEGVISLTILKPENNNAITAQQIEKAITKKTYLVCINHTSNVTGVTANLFKIGEICKKNKLIFLVDTAQSAGHINIDMQKNNINMLALAGHKGLHAPQGIGALLVNDITLKPIKYGGAGINSLQTEQPTILPDGYEVGTQSVPLIMALNQALNWTNKRKGKINNTIKKLSKYTLEKLSKIEGLTLYTNKSCNNGVISFNLKGIASPELDCILNEKYNICVRSGFHCAPLVHKHFNTINKDMLRVSIGGKNKKADINNLISALTQINKTLNY